MASPERGRAGPVLVVLAIVAVLWYALAVWLNAPQVIERSLSSQPGWGLLDLARLAWSMDRPVLPAPHQIALDLYDSIFHWPLDSPRNLLYHAAVTSSATLLGFVLGTALGVVLAVAIVHSRTLDRSLFPWIIASHAWSPLVQVTPHPSFVISTLHAPIVRLQQHTIIPFVMQQTLHMPPAIMVHRFCIMVQAAASSHTQVIFIPPGHCSTFIVHRGTITMFAAIEGMHELNIGHSIVARAIMVGFQQAVREMKNLMS